MMEEDHKDLEVKIIIQKIYQLLQKEIEKKPLIEKLMTTTSVVTNLFLYNLKSHPVNMRNRLIEVILEAYGRMNDEEPCE